MEKIDSYLGEAQTVVILGHIHPDGDCVGSCLGLYHYLKKRRPEMTVQIYLEEIAPEFSFLKDSGTICHDFEEDRIYDLCFVLDCSDAGRLGGAVRYLETAKKSVCVDHHITNQGICDVNIVEPGLSSTSEVLYTRMDPEGITFPAAECLYLGIVHDTGVFKHSNTKEQTMRIAGALLSFGVSSSHIIDDTFYKKTFVQNRMLGRALLKAELRLGGRMICSVLTMEDLAAEKAGSMDLDGIIDQLRITDGVEAAVLIHEKEPQSYKISMRSNDLADVSAVAASFGGGGHVRAAGASWKGDPGDCLAEIERQIRGQLESCTGEA